MDSIVRTISHKDDGGEVTDAEESSLPCPSVIPQRSTNTVEQQPLQQVTVSSGSTQEVVAAMISSNLVVADEIPEEGLEDNDDEEEEDDEEDDYEYEDDDDAAFSGFLVDNPAIAAASIEVMESNGSTVVEPATIEEEEQQPKQKWRQPSEEAVNMSLRAEKETSGGKRRLAQDLYRIMNQDTEEAGFSLEPSQEDSMDKWTIQLFQFDEDSKLAKDMKVLGVSTVELEMSFPDQYPFEPPFVRVTRPRFRRQTGFVMNGALCMELLTKVRAMLFMWRVPRNSGLVHSGVVWNSYPFSHIFLFYFIPPL